MIFKEEIIKDTLRCSFHIKHWAPKMQAKALIFLLHGLSDHSGRFQFAGEYFAKSGFVFFAPDLRGSGKSNGIRGHFNSEQQVMDDIDFLMKKATEEYHDIPVFVYGQSMGGNLALNYCIRKLPAISGVISSSPWIRLHKSPSLITRKIGLAIGLVFPSLSLSNGLNADDLSHDTYINNSYRNDPLVHGRISLNSFKLINDMGEWLIKNSNQLNLPLLLMHGTADRVTSFQTSQEFSQLTSKFCTFHSWPGLYHELHNEPQKLEVLIKIMEWIELIIRSNENQPIPNK